MDGSLCCLFLCNDVYTSRELLLSCSLSVYLSVCFIVSFLFPSLRCIRVCLDGYLGCLHCNFSWQFRSLQCAISPYYRLHRAQKIDPEQFVIYYSLTIDISAPDLFFFQQRKKLHYERNSTNWKCWKPTLVFRSVSTGWPGWPCSPKNIVTP